MDIIIGIFLALHNKKLALARGRRPGGFIALTLVLWFGMEIIGAVIGSLLGWSLYDLTTTLYLLILAYALAGIGGLIAYLAAKSCKPGDYYPVPPMAAYMAMPPVGTPFAPPAQPLETPAKIDIVRDYSMRGDITSWKFILNGETVGSLGNGATRSTITKQRQNTLRAVSDDGQEFAPLQFDIESGGHAEIHFKGDRFARESCTGILPMSMPAVPPMYAQPPIYTPQMPPPYGPPMYAPQMPPPYGPAPFVPQANAAPVQPQAEPEEGTTCPQCGAPVRFKDQYCRKCGTKQPGAEQY